MQFALETPSQTFQSKLSPFEAIILEAAEETFKARDEKIKKVVDSCKRLTREEFKKVIKEGDVVIPYKRAKFNEGIVDSIVTAINKWVQGSSFTSCKMVGKDCKEIVGYGVLAGRSGITKASLETFFKQHEAALVLRHKSISDAAREKIMEYMYDNKAKQPAYDTKSLLASLWHHFKGTSNKKEADEEFKPKDQKSLICSSLVLKCFQYAGLTVEHDKTIGDKYIWPKEFITSSSFTCIGGYFSKESGVK